MNENGHIYAPVGAEEVASLLGEASTDVGVLCRSKNINPYSLIRPTPFLSNRYDAPVSAMKTEPIGVARQSPSSNEYVWERKQWGYQVSFVGMPQNVNIIRDIAWYRPEMTDSDWANLSHFDGYIHNAVPSFYWGVTPTELMEGDIIDVWMSFGSAQEDIISPNGKANKGGVVSVLEVFGDAPFYCGVMISYNSTRHYYFNPNPINATDNNLVVINTGLSAVTSRTYEVTPFISNKAVPNGGAVPSDMRCYSLKFAPDFESYKTLTCMEAVIGITVRAVEWDVWGEITKIEIVIQNQTQFNFLVGNFRLVGYEYRTTAEPRKIDLYVDLDQLMINAGESVVKQVNTYVGWFDSSSTSAMLQLTAMGTRSIGGDVRYLESNFIQMKRERQ